MQSYVTCHKIVLFDSLSQNKNNFKLLRW